MKKFKYELEVYKTTNGQFAWRIRHRNGKIVADSAETYKRKGSATKSLLNLVNSISEADFELKEV